VFQYFQIVLFGFSFLAISQPYCLAAEAQAFPTQRQFSLTYEATLRDFPAEAEEVRLWIPLAKTREGQVVTKRIITTSRHYDITTESVHGNDLLFMELTQPFPEVLNVRIDYEANVAEADFLEKNKEQTPDLYLQSSRLMVVNDEVRKIAAEKINQAETWNEKARAIYDYVIGHMEYNKSIPGWGKGDTGRACLLGKGNCTDFHSLFISVAQASEIPARFKIGFTIPREPAGVITGYHCWAEFYEPSKGWQPVDASDAWKHPELKEAYFGKFDANKFLLSVGRDVMLAPPQAAEPINILFYPYVEIDGEPWQTNIETKFTYQNKTKP